MYRLSIIVLVFVSPFVVAGCSGKLSWHAPDELRDSSLAGRLKAALRLTDAGARTEALARLAREAADDGSAEIASEALENIGNAALRDRVTADCAYRFARGQHGAVAVEIASLIANPALRATVLRNLGATADDLHRNP